MYGIFQRRYLDDIFMSITKEVKRDVINITDTDYVANYVFEYFKKYYNGPEEMMPKSGKEIRRWFSAGEFPFIHATLFRDMDGKVHMGYIITR